MKGFVAKVFVVLALILGLNAGAGLVRADKISGRASGAGSVMRRGPVTNLPLPRFVSLKSDKANVRRGPSLNHRVDWVFTKAGMPLEITAEFGNWRRVRDPDGQGGWVHYSLLSGVRTVLVEKDYTPLREKPRVGARPTAYAEQGVIAYLGSCAGGWCRIRANGYQGWVLRSEIWGVLKRDFKAPR